MKNKEQREKLEKNIFIFGWTSFFEDVSSQMNYSIIPLFLANTLGLPKAFIGLVEGIAETTASLLKVLFGWLSDKLKTRKSFAVTGYAITAASRPFLALATKGWHVLGLRFADRTGKGIRTSPRDALIADSADEENRGRAFGFHRALDTAGAVVGPLIAFLLLYFFKAGYRQIFLISVIPAVIAVLIISGARERKCLRTEQAAAEKRSVSPFSAINSSADFKKFLVIIGFFTLSNSSDAFLILRASNLGVSSVFIPVLYLLFNLTYAVSAVPSGILSDRIGSKRVIFYGFLVYAFVYFGFALASCQAHVWLLFIIYGFYYGLTDGVSRAFVSKLLPCDHRATAFGVYHGVVGIAIFPASLLMGFLWDFKGPGFAFMFAAFLALTAAVLLITWLPKKQTTESIQKEKVC